MKLVVMWVLAAAWFLVLAYLSVDAFTSTSPIIASDRLHLLRDVLAGVGALAMGLLPVLAAATVHHLHRRRLRHRLEKQKAKIEKRLARLDERRGTGQNRAPRSAGSPT